MKKKFLVCLLFCFSLGSLFSQETDHKYLLFADYETDHYTRESALERELGMKAGRSFSSEEEMLAYIDSKVQHLLNMRVFADVWYSLEAIARTEEQTTYLVTMKVKGSWTLYPIPYPKYDSNSGFRLGIKTYYDNFFGTLTRFYLGTNMDFKRIDGKIRIPQWTINPEISNIKIGRFTFSGGLSQRYRTSTQYIGGAYTQNYNFHSTDLSFGTSLSLPHNFSLSLGPSMTFYYGYKDNLPNNGSNITRTLYDFSLGSSLGYGQINWKGNFRRGWGAGVSHSMGFDKVENEDIRFITGISGNVRGFYNWARLNPSARIYGSYSFNGGDSNKGSELRGVRDDEINGYAFACLNLDLNISVIRWKGVGEAQFEPFFDIGAAWMRDEPFDRDRDLKYSAGADFILYLDVLRSLVARASIGVNLKDHRWNEGRKYELTIESSLHY